MPITNAKEIADSIEFHGEDSDYVRRRFTAQFPRQGVMQFFPSDQIEEAMGREAVSMVTDDLVMGIDVGWQGDESVISFRKGFDCRTESALRLHLDPEALFAKIMFEYRMRKPQQIFIDSTGMGGPIYNRLQHQNVPVIGISFGGKSEGYTKVDCANRKAELYTVFREHLGLLALPLDKELRQQMINVEGELNRQGKVQIESKQDLRRRGLPSPDFLESLILTVAQGINNEGVRSDWGRGDHLVRSEYDPFARESVDGPPRMPPRVYAPGWARLREDD